VYSVYCCSVSVQRKYDKEVCDNIATACCLYLSDSLVLIRPDPTESTTFVYDTFHVLLMGQYASVIIQTDNQSNHLLCLI